jgi:putative sterol carrier protein
MAESEQATLPSDVTPARFFEELLPMGFAAQAEGAQPQSEVTLKFVVTGDQGGTWVAKIAGGQMTTTKGDAPADISITVSETDWRDAVLQRNGATLGLLLPQRRPDRPDNTARVKTLKGTIVQELARDGGDPFKVELSFGGAAQPRCTIKMKLPEFLDMQTGKLNGQEAFMTGKLKFEGDLGFLMQISAVVV